MSVPLRQILLYGFIEERGGYGCFLHQERSMSVPLVRFCCMDL